MRLHLKSSTDVLDHIFTSPILLRVVIPALLALGALAALPNRDESQYVAGAVLVSKAQPFGDFLALQPSLTLWVWMPFAVAVPGWAFLAVRLSSALFSVAMLWMVHAAERLLGISSDKAIGAPLMACCHIVLFIASVARNDAFPGMLLTLGMWAGLKGLAGGTPWLSLSGLALGLAGAAKLSFLPPLACVAVALFFLRGTIGWRGLTLFALSAALGVLPIAVDAIRWPDAYWYGVFKFGAVAPPDWYRLAGRGSELGSAAKLLATLGALAAGPALAALIMVLRQIGRIRFDPRRLFLIALILGGLAGGILPTPSHPQYLLPMLPPLFVLLSLDLAMSSDRRPALLVLGAFGLVGLTPSLAALSQGFPALASERQAHQIHAIAASHGVRGTIATLSPQRVVDSGLTIDRRFATGPFVFRSPETLSADEGRRFHVATPDTLAAMFADSPPQAILTGYEPGWRPGMAAVDAPLRAWAVARRYHGIALSDGQGQLYLRPARRRLSAPHPRR